MKALLASFLQKFFCVFGRVPEECEFLGYEAFTELTAVPIRVETAEEITKLRNQSAVEVR